jgi:hypothetical protein
MQRADKELKVTAEWAFVFIDDTRPETYKGHSYYSLGGCVVLNAEYGGPAWQKRKCNQCGRGCDKIANLARVHQIDGPHSEIGALSKQAISRRLETDERWQPAERTADPARARRLVSGQARRL